MTENISNGSVERVICWLGKYVRSGSNEYGNELIDDIIESDAYADRAIADVIQGLNQNCPPTESHESDAAESVSRSSTSMKSRKAQNSKYMVKLSRVISDIFVEGHPNVIRDVNKNDLISLNSNLKRMMRRMEIKAKELEGERVAISPPKLVFMNVRSQTDGRDCPIALRKTVQDIAAAIADVILNIVRDKLSDSEKTIFVEELKVQRNTLNSVIEAIEDEIRR